MPQKPSILLGCLTALAAMSADAQMLPAPRFNPVSPWPPSVMPNSYSEQDAAQPGGPSPPTMSITPHAALPLARPQGRSAEPALPLAPRGQATSVDSDTTTGSTLLTTAGSLALVLCLFFAAAWVLRRGTPHSPRLLPSEVFETLGRAPLPGRHQMHLIRCGHKLLLVSVSAAGADTLTEITDPLEVDRLCGLCRENHPGSSTATFRSMLNSFGGETATERGSPASNQSRLGRPSEDLDA